MRQQREQRHLGVPARAVVAARVQAPHADRLPQAQRRQRRADGAHGEDEDERHCPSKGKEKKNLTLGLPQYRSDNNTRQGEVPVERRRAFIKRRKVRRKKRNGRGGGVMDVGSGERGGGKGAAKKTDQGMGMVMYNRKKCLTTSLEVGVQPQHDGHGQQQDEDVRQQAEHRYGQLQRRHVDRLARDELGSPGARRRRTLHYRGLRKKKNHMRVRNMARVQKRV